ncbi:DUF2334 domain-containing protein [Thermodesulfobacteriota bacterium]
MSIALRIDDIGASSKQYEVYSKKLYGLGNLLFLKYMPAFMAWGPYREMTPVEWDSVFEILDEYNAKLTVSVTACWVEYNGSLINFDKKYPEESRKLKQGMKSGLLEIANHGLTHCVTEQMKFRPRFFMSNRKYHREFWDWLPDKTHFEHIELSQKILQDYFETDITTFVPPGNVYSEVTEHACLKYGIKTINCNTVSRKEMGINIIGNDQIIDFHDREMVIEGTEWLKRRLEELPDDSEYIFVKEL